MGFATSVDVAKGFGNVGWGTVCRECIGFLNLYQRNLGLRWVSVVRTVDHKATSSAHTCQLVCGTYYGKGLNTEWVWQNY